MQPRSARWGRALLYVLCFSLAFMRPQVWIGGLAAMPTDMLAVAAGLCWLAAGMADRRYRRWDRLFAVVLAYFGVMVVSAVFADSPLPSFGVRLAGEAYLLALPAVVYGLLVEESHFRRACLAWLLGTGCAIAILVVALAVAMLDPQHPLLDLVQHHLGSLRLGPFVRYKLTFINPNMLGAYLTASLMIALLAADRGWVRPIPAILLIGGIAMALIATFSAGIGGGLLAGAIWYWLRQRESRPRRAWCALALGGLCALAFVAAQALTPIAYPQPMFALNVPGTGIVLLPASRMQTWAGALQTFLAHPVTGIGMGSEVAHVRFVEPSGAVMLLTDGHNVLLDLAAECGVPGVLAMLAIVVGIWRRTAPVRIDGLKASIPTVALGIGVLDVLVYQGVGGGFENARFVWAMIGLLLVAARLRRQERNGCRVSGASRDCGTSGRA